MLDFVTDLSDWAVAVLKDSDVWQWLSSEIFDCATACDCEELLTDYGFNEQSFEY